MDLINQSLLITAIGMGLVFILILLLWGFMAAFGDNHQPLGLYGRAWQRG